WRDLVRRLPGPAPRHARPRRRRLPEGAPGPARQGRCLTPAAASGSARSAAPRARRAPEAAAPRAVRAPAGDPQGGRGSTHRRATKRSVGAGDSVILGRPRLFAAAFPRLEGVNLAQLLTFIRLELTLVEVSGGVNSARPRTPDTA